MSTKLTGTGFSAISEVLDEANIAHSLQSRDHNTTTPTTNSTLEPSSSFFYPQWFREASTRKLINACPPCDRDRIFESHGVQTIQTSGPLEGSPGN